MRIIIRVLFLLNYFCLLVNCNEELSLGNRKRLPKAIIIGSKKSGTRALLNFIGVHPNVSTANTEIHFFDRYYDFGLDWYRNQMPISNENQITIEKTPKYFVDKQVPKRVYKMNPNVKLILVIRNPIVRAISDYTQSLEKSNKASQYSNTSRSAHFHVNASKQFENMLFDDNKEIKANWSVVRNGLYSVHLNEWLKYFPMRQILFINGEELIRNPFKEIEKVERFLNLKPLIKKEHFIYNQEKGFPCIMKPLDSGIIRCLNDQKGRKHPVISAKVLNKLNKFYHPYSVAFFKKIHQEPFWSI